MAQAPDSDGLPQVPLTTYTGLCLLSTATLLLEVLHTRILSFMLWPSLVYIVVTFAMLGMGISGVALSIYSPVRWVRPERNIALLALAFAVTAVLGIVVIGRYPIAAFELRSDPRNLGLLVLYYLLLTSPFFFSGLAIGALFTVGVRRVNKLYALNLVGSAAGCVLLVVVIRPFGGEGSLWLCGVLGAIAAALFAARAAKGVSLLAHITAVAGAVLMLAVPEGLIEFRLDPDKGPAKILNEPGGQLEYTGWSAISRTDIMTNDFMEEGSHIAGLLGRPWPHKWITTDASAGTPLVKGVPEELIAELRRNDEIMEGWRMLPYVRVDDPDPLIIGVGGGADVISAQLYGIEKIAGVDINPITIHALKHTYRDYTLDLYNRPNMDIRVAEGRSFVSRSDRKFTNIHMNGVDTFTALASGAYVMAENYLYTVEGMMDYLEHLEDDGYLTIVRMSFEIPRETIKLCTALIEAFERMGRENPEEHVMIFGERGSPWSTFLCKNSPLTAEDLVAYEQLASERDFLIYYKPGMELSGISDPDLERNRYFTGLFEAAAADTLPAFYRDYPYDIRAATDNRPFFFNVHRSREMFRAADRDAPYEQNFGVVALFVLLVQTLVMSALLIVLPLLYFHREGLRFPNSTRFLVYFSGLGVGFMFVELALMQKLTLLLGHPTYSIAIALASILFFSGVGSLVSGGFRLQRKSIVFTGLAGIGTLIVLYVFILPGIIEMSLGSSFPARAMVAAGSLAPLAFFMGMPFPSGLRIVEQVKVRFVPWAWGVNGVGSVLGVVGAIFLAMNFGFTVVLLAGLALYVMAGLAMAAVRFEAP